ncbi:hypothetical protein XBLMG947_0900 [Xanthomonas bromi]|uniref:Uncharacterized protein n=1 Tax=Xanthomonas bromi TaxID=56449 RepID=A0A1C3NIH6_9XANT|nr:hypothetical protein XBLMG947_0900 [Xanthomonas bromi]
MALSLLTSGAALAAPQQHDDRDHDSDRDAQRHDDHGPDRHDDHPDGRHEDRRDDRHDAHHDAHRNDRLARRIAAASGWHLTIMAAALPTTTGTTSSRRRVGTNGIAWTTPTC